MTTISDLLTLSFILTNGELYRIMIQISGTHCIVII